MGTPVYIKCCGEQKRLIVDMYPGLNKYVRLDGLLYCHHKKALHGCAQTFKLCHMKLSKFLQGCGYEKSETDLCLFCKIVGECVYILMVYVDEILICSRLAKIESLKKALIVKFRWIMTEVGERNLYTVLGSFPMRPSVPYTGVA
jgi:hypothetical protein